MKLNFWQWLGVILLIGGLALYFYERREKTPEPPKSPVAPSLTSAPA